MQIAVDDILRKRGGRERLKYMTHVSPACTILSSTVTFPAPRLPEHIGVQWHLPSCAVLAHLPVPGLPSKHGLHLPLRLGQEGDAQRCSTALAE